MYSKRKEFALHMSKLFPIRVDPFSEGSWCTHAEGTFSDIAAHVVYRTLCDSERMKRALMQFADNTGPDQPAFVVRLQN